MDFFGAVAVKSGSWNRKQKRLFQRSMSGVELALIRGERVRCLHFGITPEMQRQPQHLETFSRLIKAFIKRIRRKYPLFEYIGQRQYGERGGLLHIHFLFRGSYIPQRWLSSTWEELTGGAFRVYINEMQRWKKKSMGAYLCRYVSRDATQMRYMMSWRWVYRGFVRDWRDIVHCYQKSALSMWLRLLNGCDVELGIRVLRPPWVSQSSLVA